MSFQRGFKLRSSLIDAHTDQETPKTLFVLEPTFQVKGLHTFIRYVLFNLSVKYLVDNLSINSSTCLSCGWLLKTM